MGENKLKLVAVLPNMYESNSRIYSGKGIARTITARDWKDAPKVMVLRKRRSKNE